MKVSETGGNTTKTDGSEVITNNDLARMLGGIMEVGGHQDAMLHDVKRKVDEMYEAYTAHRAGIERAAALADPGAAVRRFFGGAGRGRGDGG